jgi:hypothetical protein
MGGAVVRSDTGCTLPGGLAPSGSPGRPAVRGGGRSAGAGQVGVAGCRDERATGLGDTLSPSPPGPGVDATDPVGRTLVTAATRKVVEVGVVRLGTVLRCARVGGEETQLIPHTFSITLGWDSYSPG